MAQITDATLFCRRLCAWENRGKPTTILLPGEREVDFCTGQITSPDEQSIAVPLTLIETLRRDYLDRLGKEYSQQVTAFRYLSPPQDVIDAIQADNAWQDNTFWDDADAWEEALSNVVLIPGTETGRSPGRGLKIIYNEETFEVLDWEAGKARMCWIAYTVRCPQ